MLRQFAAIAVVFLVARPFAQAANEAPVHDMQQVIASDARLTADQKARLQQIVADVLANQPEWDDDKRVHAGEHLRTYLDDSIAEMQSLASERPDLFKDKFQWALKRYAARAPITEQDREAMRRLILSLASGIRAGIDAVYLDTPEPVRAELAKEVEAKMRALAASGRVGNYYYFQYLYPPQQEIRPEKVWEEWAASPAMAAEREAFKSTVGSQDAGEGLHQGEYRHFVVRETVKLESRIGDLIEQVSDQERLRQGPIVLIPKGLQRFYLRSDESAEDRAKRLKEDSDAQKQMDRFAAEDARLKEKVRAALEAGGNIGNAASSQQSTKPSLQRRPNSSQKLPSSQPATKAPSSSMSPSVSQKGPTAVEKPGSWSHGIYWIIALLGIAGIVLFVARPKGPKG